MYVYVLDCVLGILGWCVICVCEIVWVTCFIYAPNFEKNEGSYCFGIVCPSVCLFKIYEDKGLEFHVWNPH